MTGCKSLMSNWIFSLLESSSEDGDEVSNDLWPKTGFDLEPSLNESFDDFKKSNEFDTDWSVVPLRGVLSGASRGESSLIKYFEKNYLFKFFNKWN